ncbi:MAG: hypothetical protein WBJ59_03845, partial [Dysgonamonadaceae bacterium]
LAGVFLFFLLKTLIMQKFKLSWMALLRNDEHAQLIEQLCGILDDCPIDNLYVTKAAAKVKLHLPALRCVRSESRKHELTAVLDELSEKRRRTLISLDNGSAPVAIPDFTRGHWNDVQGYRHAFVE